MKNNPNENNKTFGFKSKLSEISRFKKLKIKPETPDIIDEKSSTIPILLNN
jgi:hypothetical protein